MGSGSSKPKGKPAQDTDLVLTPGGWRPRSTVIQVEPGQHVAVQEGRIRVIETATGKVIADLGPMPETKAEKQDADKPKGGAQKRAKKAAKGNEESKVD